MPSNPKRTDYYAYVANQRCLVCEDHPVHVAHIRATASAKTKGFMPRRSGPAAYAVIPLCPTHHVEGMSSIHSLSEAEFERQHGFPSGYLAGTALRLMAEWIEGS